MEEFGHDFGIRGGGIGKLDFIGMESTKDQERKKKIRSHGLGHKNLSKTNLCHFKIFQNKTG